MVNISILERTERFERNPESTLFPGFWYDCFLYSHTRRDSKGGCHGGKDGNENVQDFTPNLFVFHS